MTKFMQCHCNGKVVFIRKLYVVGVTQHHSVHDARKIYTIGDNDGWNVDEPIDWIINEIERED